jgi:hypothetical protein
MSVRPDERAFETTRAESRSGRSPGAFASSLRGPGCLRAARGPVPARAAGPLLAPLAPGAWSASRPRRAGRPPTRRHGLERSHEPPHDVTLSSRARGRRVRPSAIQIEAIELLARPLKGAVHRGLGRVEELGGLDGAKPQHVLEDHSGALARTQLRRPFAGSSRPSPHPVSSSASSSSQPAPTASRRSSATCERTRVASVPTPHGADPEPRPRRRDDRLPRHERFASFGLSRTLSG